MVKHMRTVDVGADGLLPQQVDRETIGGAGWTRLIGAARGRAAAGDRDRGVPLKATATAAEP
jgi:hypothetical protein